MRRLDLQVLWQDSERILCRGQRPSDRGREAVLAVLPAVEHPPLALLDRLAHEFSLRDVLEPAWAVRPIELQRDGDRIILLLEDPGGEPLERLLDAPMETEHFLPLAIRIAATLGKAHGRGLVHKDVKPANILVNCSDGEARLAGFGVASRAPRERQRPEPPEFIAGTLAYMAPEQTGRMNRSIDSRCDLYALGVVFYRMLTGGLPFSAADPLEWVHCHVARKPAPPAERVATIPAALSQIVLRLLAKNAEDRYQTAVGLEHDLRLCLRDWRHRGRIEPFALCKHDEPDRLVVSEKLYGREHEIETLLQAFDRVVESGAPELVLIAGQAGVGKSAAAQELHRALATRRGLFASGKFDQLKRDIPYASLAQAIRELIRPLLARSEGDLSPWRSALAAALGPNGALMVTLVPDLEFLVGTQPPAPELPPPDARRRFQLVFRRLLAVFARPEHPLALFLDDLQWLDAATLDCIEDLLTQPDVGHLLLVGAYRDDEVAPSHPLMRRLAAIRLAGGRVREIMLKPLALDDVSRIVSDALHTDRVRSLARLVHEKTAGNPFFAIQFLTAVAEEELLVFDRNAGRWTWNLEGIRAKGYTDNVVDLMLGKLRRLPETTRAALKHLACLGASAPTATLALAQGKSEEALHAALWESVRERLLLRQEGTYRFLHDRVREAAYALIPDSERAAAHLAIGRRLAAGAAPHEVEEKVFEIVGQLNRGSALICSGKEGERLAELNLIAGQRAKFSTAYASALTYLSAGAALLPEDAWDRLHDLVFALELNRAECEFLTGVHGASETRLAALANRAVSPSELATLTRLQVDLFMTLGRSDRAVAVGLECLRRFGIIWSAHPTKDEVQDEYARIWRGLGDRPIEALMDLPPMADSVARAAMDVLTSLVTPALFTDEHLRCLVIGRMGNLSLEHGSSEASCYAYTAVGNVLCLTFNNYEAGFRFGQLGLDLADQPGMERLRARVYLAFGNLAKPSPRHGWTGRPIARHAFETAQQAGDLTYAAISCNNLLTELLAAGAPLADAQREAEAGLDFARGAHFGLVEALIATQLQLIRTLRGLTPVFGCFNDDRFDEIQFERQLEEGPSLGSAVCLYWIRKLQARVLAGDPAAAIAAAAKAERLLWMTPAILERADYHSYAALALAALCGTVSDAEGARCRAAAAAHQRQLQVWAEHCPENFASRAALISAETARLEGRELDAEHLYEQAIRLARRNALIHDEALANELAARFYEARGFPTIAQAYLHSARRVYARWGAEGKVRQLAQTHPRLSEEERAPSPTSTIGAPIEQLDLATVIKVSQTVSSEIVLDKVIDTLMRTAIEQAGAERGLLLLAREAEFEIAAEAKLVGDGVAVQLGDEPVTGDALPKAVLNIVRRTREPAILEDAAAQSPFADDPYIRERRAHSILCLPLLNRAKLIGVLYLENNLATRVFSPGRIAVLKLLASQAAISIENTKLYRDLAEREAKIRRLVDANIIGIFISEPDGRFVEANEAFLQMLGLNRGAFDSGIAWADLTPPEWLARDAEALSDLKTIGAAQPYEREYLHKSGRRVPVMMGLARIEDGSSRNIAFVLDLSERKRAEQALRDSEARLEKAQRIAHIGWWERDFATNRVSLSEEVQRTFGVEPVDLPDWHERWLKLIHAEDRPRAAEAAAAALDGGPRYDLEYRVIRPDGAVRIVHSQGDVIWDRSGRPVRQFGVLQDITELRQAEGELRASEGRFRTFVDHATDAFFVLDDQSTVLDVNRQACDSLGYSPQELIGMHRRHFDVGQDDGSIQRLKQNISDEEALTFETRHRRKDGTVFPVEIRIRQFGQGERRFLCLVRDITERKRAAAALLEMQAELAHANRVATMGQLTASIAHEVNQPIAATLTNAQASLKWLRREPPDLNEVRDGLGRIVRDAARAGEVVARIRALFKKAPRRGDPVEINRVVLEVIEFAQSEAAKSRVSVLTELEDSLPAIQGDRVELQQVVLNLVLNAIEAMRDVESTRELRIVTRKIDLAAVLVVVRDTGPGLAADMEEKLFKAFYTTKPSGLGLGLSICRSIVEAHGGRLWASPNSPRGAVFQFTLPSNLDAALS